MLEALRTKGGESAQGMPGVKEEEGKLTSMNFEMGRTSEGRPRVTFAEARRGRAARGSMADAGEGERRGGGPAARRSAAMRFLLAERRSRGLTRENRCRPTDNEETE